MYVFVKSYCFRHYRDMMSNRYVHLEYIFVTQICFPKNDKFVTKVIYISALIQYYPCKLCQLGRKIYFEAKKD